MDNLIVEKDKKIKQFQESGRLYTDYRKSSKETRPQMRPEF